jgi:excisionase family DNA binding protein
VSELLDIVQAAEYLGGVSTRTVYREVSRGKLRIVKVGGSTRFRRAELDRYLRDAERSSAA